ncbi:TldD/PmbA family protein [Candidatus Bathyarchaeota archaeon]|nr:TldD/PmbA family protein [Candidatus Bathyarchaeota archaeon]
MNTESEALIAHLISEGEKLGADEVEVYIEEAVLRGVVLERGTESFISSRTAGLGIRVIDKKRVGLSSTTSLDQHEAEETLRRAHSIAQTSQPDREWVSLAKNTGTRSVLGVFDPEVEGLSPDALSDTAQEMLRTVHGRNSGLIVTRGNVSTGIRTVMIANNHSRSLERKESFVSASVSVSAEEGSPRGTGSESTDSHAWRGLNISGACDVAAERALAAARAGSMPAGAVPVVWRNKLFASVLSIMFAGTLSAESVQRKRSPWAGRIGSRIASDSFTLVDEGLMPGGLGTRMFDDEGIAQKRLPLIEEGILKGFFYDTFAANKEGVESTGNASRSYDGRPHPAPNNLVLTPGRMRGADEIIRETAHGLYLEEMIGAWLSNPVSGYLSATVANGALIEKGELTRPVKGILVSGNFFDILIGGVDQMGRDTDNAGSSYSPTVRVANMSVTPQ